MSFDWVVYYSSSVEFKATLRDFRKISGENINSLPGIWGRIERLCYYRGADTFSVCSAMLWNPPQGDLTGRNGHLYSWVFYCGLKAIFFLNVLLSPWRKLNSLTFKDMPHNQCFFFFIIEPCYLSEIQSVSESNQRSN